MENILDRLNRLAPKLTYEDTTWATYELSEFLTSKINSFAYKSYETTDSAVSLLAFKNQAIVEIKKGFESFYISKKLWKEKRDIQPYILTCLRRLSDKIKIDINVSKKSNVPICPACKLYGQKEYLVLENKLLKCTNCCSTIERLELENDKYYDSEIKIRKVFSIHTKKGWRCGDCEGFIPDSHIIKHGVTCPYNDCLFFGTKQELEPMAHPAGSGPPILFSLNNKLNFTNTEKEYQDKLESDIIDPYSKLEVIEKFNQELSVLVEVVETQMERASKSDRRSVQKIFMYQAYRNMIEQYPEEMISYLVHGKYKGSPIQPRIFQEFVRVVENSLPIEIIKSGKKIEIESLLDKNLKLFCGISEFLAVVNSDHTIDNNTTENYIGGREFTDFGPCFIGYLIDVVDLDKNKSIKENVTGYTFSQITLNNNINCGTNVLVKHLRIPSHYELMSMVSLQRVRKKIVNSIYSRLTGKKRKPKERLYG